MVFCPKCGGYGLKVEDSGFLLLNFSTNGVSFEKLPFLPHIFFFVFEVFQVQQCVVQIAGWLNGWELLSL